MRPMGGTGVPPVSSFGQARRLSHRRGRTGVASGAPDRHTGAFHLVSLQEAPSIPKRIPPSQRPERKLDDTAKAIARIRDEAKEAKAAEAERAGSENPKSFASHELGSSVGPRKGTGPAPMPSTKRPKTVGN